jgi:integrase
VRGKPRISFAGGIRPDNDSFVVAQIDGAPPQPRPLTHEWGHVIKKTALTRIRFHDLLHTHASQMLAADVHPKVASERLGHSRPWASRSTSTAT